MIDLKEVGASQLPVEDISSSLCYRTGVGAANIESQR
jgi:hypothetical protein